MRFRRKITARSTALAVALGLVAVLVTALPAFAAIPIVTSLIPNTGPPGTSVQVNGSVFSSGGNATSVTFNGIGASFVVNSDILITAVAPCATSGNVHVTTPGGTDANAVAFTYTAAGAPTITSFTPTTGLVGTSVVITGTNFCSASSVLFNATAASYTVNSPTQITAVVPAGATTGTIHVTTPIVPTANSAASFTVGAATTISSFNPTSGPVGTSVIITGTGFTSVTAVRFNGTAAVSPVINSTTSITAVVPTGATTGLITVLDAGGTATSATSFTVTVGTHTRTVSFSYHGNRASGSVSVGDGTSACLAFVPVYIQQRKGGSWVLLDTTATNGGGGYNTWVPNKPGLFRAQIKKLNLPGSVTCGADVSPTRHHG